MQLIGDILNSSDYETNMDPFCILGRIVYGKGRVGWLDDSAVHVSYL